MSTIIDNGTGNVLRSVFEETTVPVLLVDPSADQIESIIDSARKAANPPPIRLLATEDNLKSAFTDFLIASHAADLIEHEILDIRTINRQQGNILVITESMLSVLVSAGGDTAALSTDDDQFVSASFSHYQDVWDNANGYRLRTPALSIIQRTLRESIGPEVEADFIEMIETLDEARGDSDGLDEVTISLLVAAKNQELLYDISKWGEDVGIASKATFSRTKTTLEDLGLIDTEKVPIDVGRPRLRLKFTHDQLKGRSAAELASVAQGLLP